MQLDDARRRMATVPDAPAPAPRNLQASKPPRRRLGIRWEGRGPPLKLLAGDPAGVRTPAPLASRRPPSFIVREAVTSSTTSHTTTDAAAAAATGGRRQRYSGLPESRPLLRTAPSRLSPRPASRGAKRSPRFSGPLLESPGSGRRPQTATATAHTCYCGLPSEGRTDDRGRHPVEVVPTWNTPVNSGQTVVRGQQMHHRCDAAELFLLPLLRILVLCRQWGPRDPPTLRSAVFCPRASGRLRFDAQYWASWRVSSRGATPYLSK